MSTKPWPADKVERRSVKSLLAYPRNARLHSEEQVDQIVASMREFGWTTPVLVDEKGVIIAGHGRLSAANKLGIEHVPVMVADGWTEEQKRAYRLADNQIPLNATWDIDLLKFELDALREGNFELSPIGFSVDQLEVYFNGWGAETDPSERDGAHTDGISSTIFVTVQPSDAESAKKAIAKTLTRAGIKHSLGGRS